MVVGGRIAFLIFVLGIVGVNGCVTLPSLEDRHSSQAITDTDDTLLGQAISPLAEAHPGKSGVFPLADGREAFAARELLAGAAERSLDIQYYIWRDDTTGTLLFEALRDAADRGVRVRLLLDDNNTDGLDPTLAALNAHPNIEVRLFNPFVIRWSRLVAYLTDFFRLNRRMHNKSFTADSQATIVGGRNIEDGYFGTTENIVFADLDVLAVGAVVNDVARDFDRYWASQSSYPVELLLAPVSSAQIAEIEAEAVQVGQDPAAAYYLQALPTSSVIKLLEGGLDLEWAKAYLVSDDPAKVLGQADSTELLPYRLRTVIGEPETEMELVSPYFVPTEAGVYEFSALARQGVRIRVLTNAFEATDVAAVHAGYAKRRESLLEAGIELYELPRLPSPKSADMSTGFMGSSGTTLHAKTLAVDSSRVFIGSFNFDPRSAHLNTEMGIVIESAELALQIERAFDQRIPENAYEVRLSEQDELYWLERRDGEILRYHTEPGTTAWQRLGIWLLARLPIDWLL